MWQDVDCGIGKNLDQSGIFDKSIIHNLEKLMQKNEMEIKNPWQKLSSRKIYQNQWFRLREDKVISPGGENGVYGVIETSPAIAIVPVTKNLETYLVGQYRYPLDVYTWEVPEGGANHDETNLDAAKRELKEETGLKANKWTYLNSMYTSNSITNEIGYIFLAEELVEGKSEPEHTEDLSIKIVPFLDAYQMVLNCEIKDSLAIIGIIRVYEHFKRLGKI
jgi:8-oxo-dGTP pyrophosphatase MutT (NUDIX family)